MFVSLKNCIICTLFSIILLIIFDDSKIVYAINLHEQALSSVEHFISFDGKNRIVNTIPFERSIKKISEYPFLLTRASFTLTVCADFEIRYIWIYDEAGFDLFTQVKEDTYRVNLPEGNYNIMTGYGPSLHQNTFIFKDSIEIVSAVEISILKTEAEYSSVYEYYREDHSRLRINSLFLTFFNNMINMGLNISFSSLDSTAFIFHYNKLPGYFNAELAVKGKQLANYGNLYLLNNEFRTFMTDTVISNDINNFASADFHYHLPDSVEYDNEIEIHTYLPESHTNSPWDTRYNSPVHLKVYQDTSAHLLMKSSVFSQGLFGNKVRHGLLYSSEIRIGKNNVKGYHYQERGAPSFVISENKNVNIGLTPTYWFGKFLNERDTIKIRSPYGRFQFLYLSQSNDVLQHYPIEFQIYKEGINIREGYFNLWFGAVALRLGFDVNDLTIWMPDGAAKYEMVITDNYNEVAGYAGISTAIANFDLNQMDKNPPNIVLFQILENSELANVMNSISDKSVRFIAEDNEQINSCRLYYATLGDTIWSELSVNYDNPYWKAAIPTLPSGYYSLKLFIDDLSGNYIECNMEPAFLLGDVASIEQNGDIIMPEKLVLHQNYPNPFNNTTIISYSVPSYYSEKIEISIYSILGQLIKSYNNVPFINGRNKIQWDGKDEFGHPLSSGIYLLTMKGGDVLLNQKILIIK